MCHLGGEGEGEEGGAVRRQGGALQPNHVRHQFILFILIYVIRKENKILFPSRKDSLKAET